MIRVFSFLKRDYNSGNLTFRYVIPERYRQVFRQREIKRSLKTTDRRVAMRKYKEFSSARDLSNLEIFLREARNP